MENRTLEYTRRDFVKLLSLVTAGAGLPLSMSSCQGSNPESKPQDIFELLKLVRKGLRESPDYLPERAKEAVASKDAKTIFEFVKNNFQTLPDSSGQTIPVSPDEQILHNGYRWGINGCLRYGAGTFYEKAALLEKLLNDAGFNAKLKSGKFDIEKAGWENVFFKDFELPFEPNVPNSLLKKRLNGYTPNENIVTPAELNDEKTIFTVNEILNNLPKDFVFPNPNWHSLTEKIYEVEFIDETDAASKKHLNPSLSNAQFGRSYIEGTPQAAGYSEPNTAVNFKVRLANLEKADHPEIAVEGRIPLEVLYRGQMVLTFQSSLTTREALTTPRKNINVLAPLVTLAGESITEEEKNKYTFAGKFVHLNGNVLEVKDDQLLIDGKPTKAGKEHPELRKTVTQIESTINASKFPEIELRFTPKDASGNIVEALDGVDFALSEDESEFPFQLTSNKKQAPKIMLMLDLSKSVPNKFRNEGAVEFGDKLISKIHEAIPNAEFMISWFEAEKFIPVTGWVNEKKPLIDKLRSLKGKTDAASYLWAALKNASASQNSDVIIFITDGVTLDKADTATKAQISKGCPVILMGVGEEMHKETLEEMAALTGGVVKTPTEHNEAIQFIEEYTKSNLVHPYALKYRSIKEGKTKREVSLTIKDNNTKANNQYTVPENKGLLLPGWTGIYLELSCSGFNASRTIAGRDLYSAERWNPVTSWHMDNTEAGFFGSYRINFEGSEPTFSMLMDDLFAAKLSQENFYKALEKSEEETLKALEDGFITYPDGYFYMQSPFSGNSGKDYITYQDGIRATIFSLKPQAEDGRLIRKVDMLPWSQWRTIHKDPETAFKKTLEHSLKLMNLEAKNYPTATMNLLGNKKLEFQYKNEVRDWLSGLWTADKQSEVWKFWSKATHLYTQGGSKTGFYLPADKSIPAFYTVDMNSGTATAIFDGGGAGTAATNNMYARLTEALTVFALVISRLNIGGGVGVWVSLEKIKLQYLQMSTIAIITMRGPTNEDLNQMLRNSACDAGMMVAGELGGTFMEIFGAINDLLDLAGHPAVSGCEVH